MSTHPLALAALVLSLGFAAQSSRAVVGPASERGPLEAYVATLLTRTPRGAGFCSAVLLRQNILLTAAHCAAKPDDARAFYRSAAGQPAFIAVAALAIHPDFAPDAIAARKRSIDLALALLDQPMPDRFKPAALDDGRAIAVGDRFRVAGYGLGREGAGSSGGVFRWGVVAARAPLSSSLLWTEDPAHAGLGACAGDSGGPIFGLEDDRVVAISDWTAGADRRRHCGALTQGALVAPQRRWIDDALARWKAR